jgi:Leucine-rich repeat (LRR) protein
MATFNIEEYLNSLSDDIEYINLYRLCISYHNNHQVSISPSLERFTNLKNLNYGNSDIIIKKIPETVIEFSYPNNKNASKIEMPNLPSKLEVFGCDHNNLIKLPPLPNTLKFLSCDNNQLTTISNLSYDLEKLYCSFNKIKIIDVLPINLKILDIGKNLLEELPILPDSLEILKCDNNRLTNIKYLPPNLKRFECHNNKITSIYSLPKKLEELYCINNKLTSLPNMTSSMKYLVCFNNELPFEDVYSWNIFNKFKFTYYKLKFRYRLERYYIKNIRNKEINKEVIDIVYSPNYNFYKKLLNPITLQMFNQKN